MVSIDFDKWAKVFSVLGSPERLSILLVLHGSLYLRHDHPGLDPVGGMDKCLSFSQIASAAEIESSARLSHHLSRLIETGVVDKIPFKDDKDRVFALYGVTDLWKNFARESGIGKALRTYLEAKYPDAYKEPS